MKKLLLIALILFFSFSIYSKERPTVRITLQDSTNKELTNYEKYWLEKERRDHPTLFNEDTTSVSVDTLYYVEKENTESVIINNYYIEDNRPDLRFNLTFGYGYSYYPYYYPYYYSYYPYYYSYYPYYYSYYPYYYSRPYGRNYGRSSALGYNRNYYRPYNKTYKSGTLNAPLRPKSGYIPRNMTNNSVQQKRYIPSYNKPVTQTRPSYNKTTKRVHNSNVNRKSNQRPINSQSTNKRINSSKIYKSTPNKSKIYKSTPNKSNYKRSTYNRSNYNKSYSAPSRAPSRSYSAPSRAPSRSYSAPSRAPSRSSSGRSSSGGSRSGGKK